MDRLKKPGGCLAEGVDGRRHGIGVSVGATIVKAEK
jgi:hypothetical protein